MQRFVRFAACCGVVAVLAVALPLATAAHEVREVGQYRMVVGFLVEPAFAGDRNGLDLRITRLAAATPTAATPAAGGEDTGTPVEGLDTTLQAEVIYLDQTMPLSLSPRFRDPGAYNSYFFPSQPGDYTFRIFGTVEGVAIDESFTSSTDGFGAVQDPAPLVFPKPSASGEERESAAAGFVGGAGGGDDGIGGGAAAGLVLLTGAAGLWLVRRGRTPRPALARA